MLKKSKTQIAKVFKKIPLFKKKYNVFILLITFAFVIYLLTKIDFVSLGKALKDINIFVFLALLLISIFQFFLYYRRFNLIAGKKGVFSGYIISVDLARVIPSKPLGIYFRILATTKYYGLKIKEAIFATLLDDSFDLVFFIVLSIYASIILGASFFMWKVLLYTFMFVFGAYLFLAGYEHFTFIKKIFGMKFLYKLIKKSYLEIKKYLNNLITMKRKLLYYAFINSAVVYAIYFVKIYLIVRMFGYNISFFDIGAIWVLLNTIADASTLPAGLGLFEFSFATILLKSYNIPYNTGIAIAMVERFVNIWFFVVWGILYYIFNKSSIFVWHEEFKKMFFQFTEQNILKAKKTIKGFEKIIKKVKK